jgi:streptogramin lyase
MKRREFLNAAAMTAGGAALAVASPSVAEAQSKMPGNPAPFTQRPAGNVEILFKAPGLSGNGLQCTDEGIWTIDNAGSRSDTPGRCKVYLSSYEGKLIRELSPEGTGPSGIGVTADNNEIWIGSTYSREIIHASAKTGETIGKHFTPGAGVIYQMTTDPAARPNTYGASVRPPAPAGEAGAGRGGRGGRGAAGAAGAAGGRQGGRGATTVAVGEGRNSGYAAAVPGQSGALGTGAHGIQTQNGKIWVAVPPGRMIYRIDPATWRVEHMFPSVGNRPHGIGMDGNNNDAGDRYIWESDTNWGAFFKRDPMTGAVVDAIKLPDGAPFPHGMSVHGGYIYWVDDIGGGNAPVCRVKI